VDDQVLKKPGKLTPEEFGLMRTSTQGREYHASVAQLKGNDPGRSSCITNMWTAAAIPRLERRCDSDDGCALLR